MFHLLKDRNVEQLQNEESHSGAEGRDEDGDDACVEGDVVGDLCLKAQLTSETV